MTEPVTRARPSVATTFILHAAVSGTWGPRVPALKAQAGLTDGALGVALFGMAAGLLAGTRTAGAVVDRYGSRTVLRIGLPLLCATLLLPALAHTLLTLGGGLFVLGFASGTLDVAMNAQGVELERKLQRPILNGLHGLWSVGLGLGAVAATLATAVGATPIVHFLIAATVIAVVSVVALDGLSPDRPLPEKAQECVAGAPPTLLWSSAVLLLGGIAFASFVGEGSMSDWSAVYLRQDLGTSAGVAAAGFVAFSVAMAASRFAGNRLAAVLGPVWHVRLGSATAALALGIGLGVDQAPLAIAAFALFGAGLAPVVPTAFSAAGRVRDDGSARVLGRVVTFGYVGSVLGPLVIGGLSEITSVRFALVLPVVLALTICAGARSLAPAQGG